MDSLEFLVKCPECVEVITIDVVELLEEADVDNEDTVFGVTKDGKHILPIVQIICPICRNNVRLILSVRTAKNLHVPKRPILRLVKS